MLTRTPTSVLIVEDERIVATDLQQTLADMGYEASAIAATGDEAIARATERLPDVVLMDIRIKGKRDGIETATLLRERYGVPIVYLTAHADDATVDRAKHTQPYGYLIKPVKSAELRSAIEVSVFKHDMEKRLRESERWFSTTLRSIDDAVISVDLSGRINFMNPKAEVLTGVRIRDAVGRRPGDILKLTTESGETLNDTPLDVALRERAPMRLPDSQLAAADGLGKARVITDVATPVLDEGELLGAVMVFRDVTEQRLLEKRVELAERLASLGTMAAGVAHEINNPLGVVVGNASFVLDELARMRSWLGRMLAPDELLSLDLEALVQAQTDLKSAATRIATIVADLRAFFRPTEARVGEADVRRSIEWAVRATAHEFRDRARVETVIAETPRVTLDETRLGQVLVNLLRNAAHAIPPGDREANLVSVSASTNEAGRVVIEVADTGAGMSPETLARAFDPFFTTKEFGVGTGLGLSICQGIVSAAGGEMQAESVVGHGSTFRLLLSPAVADAAATVAAPHSGPALRGRILVIDDEELILNVLRRMLRDHDLVCTTSPSAALDLIDAGEKFDVILCDMMMPKMSGIDVYEALLRRSPDYAPRVVFMSGGTVTARAEQFFRVTPNVRLEKPFESALLIGAIQEQLVRFSAGSAGA